LSAVTFLFAFVVAFTFRECSAFARFVEAYAVKLMSLTFWAVSLDFFRNVHVNHVQLPIKETSHLLYFFAYKATNPNF
jgi:hypothetical protein